MSIFHNNGLIGASGQGGGAGGYSISRSLRFNSSDSAYLSRTPGSAGNRKTWTWAGWVKRSAIGAGDRFIFAAKKASGALDNTNYFAFIFRDDTVLIGGASNIFLQTTQVFRDLSAWYHFVIATDSDQGTAANRLKLYVNGAEITTFQTDGRSNITSGMSLGVNQAEPHTLGSHPAPSDYFPGYLADIYFIDGQALTPSSFTETDATTGQLIPKAFSGSYGSQGWHLEFADNSAATATTLGKDTSGNGNNWTPNNLSVTAGAGNDSVIDVPTNGSQTDTGVGGEVRGNYCTLNPLDSNSSLTLQNGNLYASNGAASHRTSRGTIAITSGKWYWEVTLDSALTGSTALTAGIATSSLSLSSIPGTDANSYGWYNDGGGGSLKYNNNSSANYGSVISNGVVVGVAFDANAGTLTFYRNGSSQGTAYSSIPAGTYFPTVALYNVNATVNFGQRPFAYTAPSGFKALCTANLPAPLVTKPNTVMDVALYTGNGSTQTISGLGFSPDLVWIKARSSAQTHSLTDVVRGASKQLFSNLTNAEGSETDQITAFNSDGFSLGANVAGTGGVNTSSVTYAAWAWDAGSSTVTNTQGSISSQVRANPSAGFSVVTYTGTGANATVGHGLGVRPAFFLVKNRSTTSFWNGWHTSLGGPNNTSYIYLNSTAAAGADGSINYWGANSFDSSVISLGTLVSVNGNGNAMVIYAFAPVVGYSSFGSYTGNGGTDGPFVYTGFRPRWVLLKNSSSSTNVWVIYDTARDTYNVAGAQIYPNLSDAEFFGASLDVLSNGFKIRTTSGGLNSNGNVYIYAAFAESPFNYARAR